MNRLWLIPTLPAMAVGFVWLTGILLGPHYATGATIIVEATPEAIAEVLKAVENYSSWRTDIARVEVFSDQPVLHWVESDPLGHQASFSNRGSSLPEKWVSQFQTGNLAMQASRRFLLVSLEAGATQIAVKEEGKIPNPFLRCQYRFQTGYSGALEKFLVDLRKRLGE